MGAQPFCGKGPHPLLWAGWWTAHGKIPISGIPNPLNYCIIFIVCTKFQNLAAGHVIQHGGLQAGQP